jgi:dephospho-CoA kinase
MTSEAPPPSAAGRPFVIGVTGNIACGKSTVMRCLGELGAALIDADAVYHDLIAPGRPLWQTLRDRFGAGVLASDLTIDRRALGRIVFSDPSALADLDRLTHPAVIAEVERLVRGLSVPVVAIDAVKLIESGMDRLCDRVWMVVCEPDQQLARLFARDGIPRAEAERRIAAQPPAESKRGRVDLVIDNSGSENETRRQVIEAWAKLGADPRATPVQSQAPGRGR